MHYCSTRTPSCSRARRSRYTKRSSDGPDAACAGAKLLRPRTVVIAAAKHASQATESETQTAGLEQACAWRFPTPLDRARRRPLPAPPLHRAEQGASARARWTGASPRRCSCAARRPRRSTTSTRTSSSTPTRSTSPGACATPAGAACTCQARWRSTTSSSPPARCPSGGSSSWRATATCTCASTTRPRPRARCAG